MPDELISQENISRDLVRSHFDRAYFNTALDDNGALFVKDKFKVYIDVSKSQTALTFSVCFRLKVDSSLLNQLELANSINKDLLQIKALVTDNLLSVEYDLWIEGGIAPKDIVLAYRHFVSQSAAAVRKDLKKVFL